MTSRTPTATRTTLGAIRREHGDAGAREAITAAVAVHGYTLAAAHALGCTRLHQVKAVAIAIGIPWPATPRGWPKGVKRAGRRGKRAPAAPAETPVYPAVS